MNGAIRMLILVLGSIVASCGMSFAIRAGLGGAALAVLWQGLSLSYGITLGTAALLISSCFLLFNCFYDRSQIHIGTVIHQIVYSWFLDVFNRIPIPSQSLAVNVVIMAISLVVYAVGVGVYAVADVGRGPYEGFCFALHQKKGWQIRNIRRISEGAIVGVGMLMGGQIGLCTIAALVINGPVIQRTVNVTKPLVDRMVSVASGVR